MNPSALQIRKLCKSFGAVRVICDLDLEVRKGERHAIIGPNGAGKTTLFNMVTGWVVPTSGEILVDGKVLDTSSPQAVVKSGFSRSFQRNMLLEGISVLANLQLACQAFSKNRWQMLWPASSYSGIIAQAKEVAGMLELDDVLHKIVKELSYGQKRQLEVAMALCAKPRILLMDEPAAGTSPSERKRLVQLIKGLPADLTLVLVEHDMDVVFELCETVTVLTYGKVLDSGTPENIRANPAVVEAYLGRRSRVHH